MDKKQTNQEEKVKSKKPDARENYNSVSHKLIFEKVITILIQQECGGLKKI